MNITNCEQARIYLMPKPQSIAEVHALAAKLTRQGVIGGGLSVGQWAQGQLRGVTFCGRVTRVGRDEHGQSAVELKASGWPGWVWVRGFNVKPCQSIGDGRCVCALRACATQAERGAHARSASPLGNTGITTVAGARG